MIGWIIIIAWIIYETVTCSVQYNLHSVMSYFLDLLMKSSNLIGLSTSSDNLSLRLIKNFLVIGLVVVTGIALNLQAYAQNSYGTLPEFTLKDSNNAPFQKNDLRGKIWLAHTFFTSCSSVCPTIVEDIKKLISGLPKGPRPSVISITVDPITDSAERLTEYHNKRDLQGYDWKLITGNSSSIVSFIENGLRLASPEDTPDAHSPRIVLIDKNSQIRGYYVVTDSLDLKRLKEDLLHLL
jgi:protein SCO1/2